MPVAGSRCLRLKLDEAGSNRWHLHKGRGLRQRPDGDAQPVGGLRVLHAWLHNGTIVHYRCVPAGSQGDSGAEQCPGSWAVSPVLGPMPLSGLARLRRWFTRWGTYGRLTLADIRVDTKGGHCILRLANSLHSGLSAGWQALGGGA